MAIDNFFVDSVKKEYIIAVTSVMVGWSIDW